MLVFGVVFLCFCGFVGYVYDWEDELLVVFCEGLEVLDEFVYDVFSLLCGVLC